MFITMQTTGKDVQLMSCYAVNQIMPLSNVLIIGVHYILGFDFTGCPQFSPKSLGAETLKIKRIEELLARKAITTATKTYIPF